VAGVSEIQIGSGSAAGNPFKHGTMLLIVAIGTIAFVAMLVLGAYAPDLRSGRNGGTHALSNAAVGYSGLVRLARATGRDPTVLRSQAGLENEDLLVISPDHGSASLTDILAQRRGRVSLLILPKWETVADPDKAGWVRVSGVLPADDPGRMLAPAYPLEISRVKTAGEPLRTVHAGAPAELTFNAPRLTQTISGKGLEPVITLPSGRIVLGKVPDGALYVLAEPDLLNNHGISNPEQGRAGLELLDFLNSTGAESVMFDVTANGLGQSRSPLKLAFDPPFLSVTLSIFACMLLAAIQALVRFGPPQPSERSLPFGKTALIDNSSALIRKAGREARLGPRYVNVIRQRAAALFRLPPTLQGEELDRRLDFLNPRRSFTELASAANRARNRDELLRTAQSLHSWVEEIKT
jgi:hypothetical protein